MKTPNCSTCNDTGRRNTGLHEPISFDLDCVDCSVAEQRVALNKFVIQKCLVQSNDLHWAIHQRALAMVPKQEPEPSLLWDAEDPEDGTHASSAEDFARNYAEAAMSKGDVSEVLVLTAVRSRTRTMRIKVKDVDDGEWLEWEWLDGAAPAAANGALTDERAAFETWAKDHLGQGYSLEIEEHTYANPVTRWAFVAFKAGRAALSGAGSAA